MVWLLLQPPRTAASQARPVDDAAPSHTPDPSPDEPSDRRLRTDGIGEIVAPRVESPAGDAWVLIGGLERALFQAGLVDVLLSRLPKPRLVLGCGASAINAVLLAQGSRTSFRRGWEQLRERHFLAGAALEAMPLVGSLVGGTVALTDVLRRLTPLASHSVNGTQVQLLAGARFVPTAGRNGPIDMGGLVALSLLERGAEPEVAAEAIRRAVEIGVSRVLLLGLPTTVHDDERLGTAIRCAGERRVAVTVIPFASSEAPRLLDYLLPGLGTQDRLVRDGREVAITWLRDHSDADR